MYLGSFHQSVSVVYVNYNHSSPTLPHPPSPHYPIASGHIILLSVSIYKLVHYVDFS